MKCAEDMLSFVGSVERVMGKLQLHSCKVYLQ